MNIKLSDNRDVVIDSVYGDLEHPEFDAFYVDTGEPVSDNDYEYINLNFYEDLYTNLMERNIDAAESIEDYADYDFGGDESA